MSNHFSRPSGTAVLLLAASLAGCAASSRPQLPVPVQAWQAIATTSDRQRLRNWRTAFTRGLSEARASGHGEAIDREGALLRPDAALGGPMPSGNYRCRVTKLGARRPGLLPYLSYPAFTCRISGEIGRQFFVKLTGSQRQLGVIYRGDQLRSPFLGTLVLGDESGARTYGTDAERDLAGWVERIGERRWRLILPYPRFESIIDVVELVPA